MLAVVVVLLAGCAWMQTSAKTPLEKAKVNAKIFNDWFDDTYAQCKQSYDTGGPKVREFIAKEVDPRLMKAQDVIHLYTQAVHDWEETVKKNPASGEFTPDSIMDIKLQVDSLMLETNQMLLNWKTTGGK